ncbi:MAG: BrnT family toxin [Chloroflexi bacterium]|nr:BrnT family toxin [Chloroflexota bacterium]
MTFQKQTLTSIAWKHNVTPDEVEEIFNRSPRYRFIETGDIEGEDLYAALGQTNEGRYLIVYFVHKATGEALIVSAREMTKKEKRTHGKK